MGIIMVFLVKDEEEDIFMMLRFYIATNIMAKMCNKFWDRVFFWYHFHEKKCFVFRREKSQLYEWTKIGGGAVLRGVGRGCDI